MKMIIYLAIFIFKIIEEALRTLRIIVIANNKKTFGAILQFFIALLWIIVTGSVIMDIKKDFLKIIIYCLGSLLGSYIGSLIEEKIAMGTNIFMIEINSSLAAILINKLKLKKYKINILKSKKENYELIIITLPRKKINEVTNIIRSFDSKINIISEDVKIMPENVK